MIHDRAPVVTVEIQIQPQPPEGSTPYWWGNSVLDFKDAERKTVWRQEFAGWGWHDTHDFVALRVEERDGFGWVIVAHYTHEHARRILRADGWLDEWVTPVRALRGFAHPTRRPDRGR